ncbi:type IV pilin protein [Chromobacterium haemolyticum]|uniref:type IV pilin protein n=1 Tax=Chromobacterium haemolyticum TaxID=394935 RepID=UPI0006924B34|nr:type IV pilin protein [Chromobacterium haemolyticum]MDH0343536.1 prepilin-type N-terminal cleavage/methylation domain-containing protein [Chromobacterium haemolyticum]BBH11216.1 hypothetical protein CH06BL_04640 [Chromobacterium haemolyticum]
MSAFVRPQGHSGFTLIEMMVVAAIVGILLLVAVPSYQRHVQAAKANTAKSDLMALSLALENHKLLHLAYPAASADSASAIRAALGNNSWQPAQTEFNYGYQPQSGSFLLTASGVGPQLSGCVLKLSGADHSANTSTSACQTQW